MGNYLFRPNLEEKLCESCFKDYKESLWVRNGRCMVCGPECLPEVAERGHPVCLQTLIKARAIREKDNRQGVYQLALRGAVGKGNVACAKILVEVGANVNGYEWYILIEAVTGGNKECVEFLLSIGADVNIAEGSGCTALDVAARDGQEACLTLLIKAGADVNSKQLNGNTALMEAAKSGNINCILSLLNAGADVNIGNIYGDTALTVAAKTKVSCNSFGPLVKAGADVNIKNVFGTPVIIDAILKCSDKELQILIDAGADVNVVDKEGNTAFITAGGRSVPGRVECVKALLLSGAVVNLKNENNKNALGHHIYKSKDLNKPPDRTMVLLLYAAGETLDRIIIDENDENTSCILDYLEKREINLRELCREAIRKQLLQLDLHGCLFNRIPQLGLPKLLTQYLLWNMSLDTSSD